jgi:uncharacterized protein (TIGR02453 family)
MTYAGLPRATFAYLADLAAHNDRAWFEANRDRYQAEWLGPGLDLAAAMAPLCAAMTPPLLSVPKLNGSLRRLHRDVRFSRDKRPYEAWLHLILSTGTAVGKGPGFHLVLRPEGVGYGAGHYGFAPEALDALRTRICDAGDRARLLSALDAARAAGSELDPADLVRVPQGWRGAPEWDHLLRRKSLIVRTPETLPAPDWLFGPECPERLAGLVRAHLPLLAWLTD